VAVVGMVTLLLGVLALKPAWIAAIKPASQGLLQHLSLLFVPAGVGVMLHLQRLGEEALAIGVALVLSTWIGMGVAALVMLGLMRLAGTAEHDA
jgi:holin-like protein